MPVTPYHFGPGAAVKALVPRHFSFTIFCFAQVVTDCETAYHMVRGEYPVHRDLHTYLGATFVAIFCIFVGRPLCRVALRLWTRWPTAPFKRYFPTTDRISWTAASTGAFIGTYSHVFLDSIMHRDVHPMSPFSSQNPFYLVISLFTLHALCLVVGVFGTWHLATHPEQQA
ncbi:MAG TPA: hypothetical protein VK581_01115 [Chthoniobacterales bacterium]|nr:hypothetical protein [Chthoniobacterales bacterium]